MVGEGAEEEEEEFGGTDTFNAIQSQRFSVIWTFL